MRNYPIALLVGIQAIFLPLHAANLERVSLTRAQFFYEQNVGQLAVEEKFAVRGAYHQARLTNNALLLQSGFQNVGYTEVRFAAPGSTPAVESVEQWPGILNRYEGSLGKVFTYVPAQRRVRYANVTPNVDLIFSEASRMPSLEWIVRPGGDAAAAGLEASNTTTRVTGGVWFVRGGLLDFQFSAPTAWQEQGTARTPVEARWSETAAGQVRLQLGAHDAARELHVSVSVKGLTPSETAALKGSVTIDTQGTIYSAATQDSPRTCTLSPAGIGFCPDAVIAAYKPDGEPVFVTVLAGKWQNEATLVALAGSAEIAVAGFTGSADFPVTAGAYQTAFGGPEGPDRRFPDTRGDAFLARLDRNTGELKSATYLGGANGERVARLAAAPGGEVSIVAFADDRFPVSADAWVARSTCVNCRQLVLARFDASIGSRLWSTFLPFEATLLKVAADGSTVIAGHSTEPDLATAGALQTRFAGIVDALVVKFAPGGGPPSFSTYFGGGADEYPSAIELEPNGDVWLAVSTNSSELLPANANPERYSGFLKRISADGTREVESRLFRDAAFGEIELSAIAGGKLAISGDAFSLPVTAGALVPVRCGGPYVARYGADGALEFATYVPERTAGTPNYIPTAGGTFLALYTESVRRLLPDAAASMQAGCVVSGAGFTNSGIVVPGQIVTLFGSGMGPETGAVAEPSNSRFPQTLGGVQVKVNGAPATLLYAQSSQINAIVPFNLPRSGTVTIQIDSAGKTATIPATAEPARLTFFTVDGTVNGFAAALNQDGSVNSPSNPARRGEVVVLFGTGMGVTSPPSTDGAVAIVDSADKLARPTELLIPFVNYAPANVLYLGQAPGLVNGVVQMNVRIPASASPEPDRAYVGTARGNTVKVAIQ